MLHTLGMYVVETKMILRLELELLNHNWGCSVVMIINLAVSYSGLIRYLSASNNTEWKIGRLEFQRETTRTSNTRKATVKSNLVAQSLQPPRGSPTSKVNRPSRNGALFRSFIRFYHPWTDPLGPSKLTEQRRRWALLAELTPYGLFIRIRISPSSHLSLMFPRQFRPQFSLLCRLMPYFYPSSKPERLREKLQEHILTNRATSFMLDNMLNKDWRRPQYYPEDIYEPYHQRTGVPWDYGLHKRKFFP